MTTIFQVWRLTYLEGGKKHICKQPKTKAREVDYFSEEQKKKKDIVLCAAIKNERRIIDEFIAFHWLQGVGKFVFYDDHSEDLPLGVLQKYIDLGIVEYHSLHNEQRTGQGGGPETLQTDSLNHCVNATKLIAEEKGYRWMLFTDLDEFTHPMDQSYTLSEYLNFRYHNVSCMQIHRTNFGSSLYHYRAPQEYLHIEAYTLRGKEPCDTMRMVGISFALLFFLFVGFLFAKK